MVIAQACVGGVFYVQQYEYKAPMRFFVDKGGKTRILSTSNRRGVEQSGSSLGS